METKVHIKPTIKWVGGKTQIIDVIKNNMPTEYNDYYEPFVGGGAVLFGIQPSNAHINDINIQLIDMYNQLKHNANSIIEYVHDFDNHTFTKEFYLKLRDAYNYKIANNILDAECTALLIWLNKHCFNGLYRVNGNGLFNVACNIQFKGRTLDEQNIISISNYLQNNNIIMTTGDFEEVCKSVEKGDFVYFDSPYIETFSNYSKNKFSMEDHERLASLFKELDKKGAKLMLSNSNNELTKELYKGYNINVVSVTHIINQHAHNKTATELLITNYQSKDLFSN